MLCQTIQQQNLFIYSTTIDQQRFKNKQQQQQIIMGLLSLLFSNLIKVISYIPCLIYSYIYSQFFTKATYSTIGVRALKKEIKNVLDIGTATGNPLHSIIHTFGEAKVLGIDYNINYIQSCKQLFQPYSNVEIKLMNFYNIGSEFPTTTFDIIIFGSSFMIMPDQTKAIEIAKSRLSEGGKIYFLLTLYDEKNLYTNLMAVIKPYLVYLSTVDFGKITFKNDFQAFLTSNKVKTTFHTRCTGNFFLKIFKFYLYEVENVK